MPVCLSFVVITIVLGLIVGMDFESKAMNKRNRQLQMLLEKAKDASVAKSSFLANMSHEIRTPMNGVLTMIKLLIETSLNKDQTDIAETILFSAENMMRLLNDILFISKVESGKIEIKNDDISIRDLTSPLINIYKLKCDQKKLELQRVIDENVPEIVKTDYTKVSQVLSNLLDNAIKFTDQGSIRLHVSRINSRLYFRITDTGIGISANSLSHLFQPFSQVHTGNTRRYGGTGLGLSICAQIVKSMKGDIRVISKEGAGSTFEFYIPIHDPSPSNTSRDRAVNLHDESNIVIDMESIKYNSPLVLPTRITDMKNHEKKSSSRASPNIDSPPVSHPTSSMQPTSTSSIASSKFINVMVAEDNMINQKVMKRLLDKAKCRSVFFDNGKEAVEAYQKDPKHFDIILMDVHMPVLSGIDATSQIREEEFSKNLTAIPIVGVTASAMPEENKNCIDSGMTDVIHKPVSYTELCDKINKYVKVNK